jgi:hypothetical protein
LQPEADCGILSLAQRDVRGIMTKKIDLKLVGVALLPALAVSVTIILLGKAAGLSEAVTEPVSQIVSFPVFLGACHAWRRRTDGAGH